MTTKISVYKEAARLLGDYRFASLSDDTATRYAFDDAWDRVVEYVLRAAYWKFALKTIEMEETDEVDPVPGFHYVWPLPCDWLRTHALFTMSGFREAPFDARHQQEYIHTRVRPPLLRYISNDFADPEVWPEHFAQAVGARLAFDCAERVTGNPAKAEQLFQLWNEKFQRALAPDAIPEWPWLRFELDGSFYRGTRWMLGNGFWKFAMKTETLDRDDTADVSAGYQYAYDKPDGWMRSFHTYEPWGGGGGSDIDFRDEDGQIHTNASSVVMRYVSQDGENAETWSDSFERACIAYLELEEVKREPEASGAALQAKALAYAEAMKNARIKNDMTERPPVNNTSTLVAARRGRFVQQLSRTGAVVLDEPHLSRPNVQAEAIRAVREQVVSD